MKFNLLFIILLICGLTGNGWCQTPKSAPVLKPSTAIKESVPAWPKEIVKMYDTVRLVFIGDVMQHGVQIKNALVPGKDPQDGDSYDYTSTFKYIRERLEQADIAVANMEFTLGSYPYSGYPQFSAPDAIAIQAKEDGIDLFQLANNHILDKGRKGLTRTLQIYDSIGVPYTGVYRDSCREAIENPVIIEAKGVKTAFINFTYGTNGIPVPTPYVVNLMDSSRVKAAISRAKERGADIIVALPHWGNEYHLNPSSEQRKWADMLFRNGVRIIVGTHPHVPQSGEIHLTGSHHPRRYGEVEKMVFYSLGNYISNQSSPEYTQLGMLVKIEIIKNNISGEVTLSMPGYEYLWCFRKGELEEHYTVVPVEEHIEKKRPSEAKNNIHYTRMVNTFEYIRSLKPIKIIK